MTDRVLAGRYELGEVIGQGGMATVYRALDRTLGRPVAVKVLRDQLAADPEIVARFEREARAAARLSHHGIVDIYDVGVESGQRFIVMELVEGENLKELVRRRGGPLPPAEVIRIGREIAAALQFAHQRGVIHRDVKPQNVLLDADGHARLTDFGIAQAVDGVSMTVTGTVLGTAHYMAPEQARGRSAGPASDVYSLGVLLYELATGRVPFDGDTPLAVALRHVEETPVKPSRLNPSVPPGLEVVIGRAMAKDPAHRYGSVAELAAALAGEDGAAPRPTARQPAVAREGRAAPGVSATAVRPPHAVQRPARPARRGGSGAPVLVGLVLASVGALALGFYWLFGARSSPAVQQATATPIRAAAAPTATAGPILAPPTALPTRETPPSATATPVQAPTTVPTAAPTAAPPPTAAPSPAPALVVVPRLVGLTLGQAQMELTARGLVLLFGDATDPRQPDGVILSQEPREGERVQPRTPVRTTVNRLATVSVPNVQGLEEAEARRALDAAGLKTVPERAAGGRKGVVNDQSPQPGVKVAPGSEVRIVLGS